MPRARTRLDLTTEKDEEEFIKDQLKYKTRFRNKIKRISNKYKKSRNKKKLIEEITKLYNQEYKKDQKYNSWESDDEDEMNKCGIPFDSEEGYPPSPTIIKEVINNIINLK